MHACLELVLLWSRDRSDIKKKLQIRLVILIRNVWRANVYGELFKTLNILPVPHICVHTDVGKYISVCVMKTVNYIKLNVGMSEQYLVRHCYYDTCLSSDPHLYFVDSRRIKPCSNTQSGKTEIGFVQSR